MTDLEILRLCALAMEFDLFPAKNGLDFVAVVEKDADQEEWFCYDPLKIDGQAMELLKKMGLDAFCRSDMNGWYVGRGRLHEGLVTDADLNRAICKCVADIQSQKPGSRQA